MSTTRGYLTDKQYQAITGAAGLGASADAIIGRAEAIIDGFIGNWQPYIGQHIKGIAKSGAVGTITLSDQDANSLPGINYLKGCVIEMLSGDAEGQYRVITSQNDGELTFDTDFDNAIAAGDVYHVYQMGKVPRRGTDDVSTTQTSGQTVYIKAVPQALREAVAWQVKYMQELGDAYFDSDALNKDSESFGSYSYTRGANGQGGKAIMAPKARQALSGTGLINRGAEITGW